MWSWTVSIQHLSSTLSNSHLQVLVRLSLRMQCAWHDADMYPGKLIYRRSCYAHRTQYLTGWVTRATSQLKLYVLNTFRYSEKTVDSIWNYVVMSKSCIYRKSNFVYATRVSSCILKTGWLIAFEFFLWQSQRNLLWILWNCRMCQVLTQLVTSAHAIKNAV